MANIRIIVDKNINTPEAIQIQVQSTGAWGGKEVSCENNKNTDTDTESILYKMVQLSTNTPNAVNVHLRE